VYLKSVELLTRLENARHLTGFWRRRLTVQIDHEASSSSVELFLMLVHHQKLLSLLLKFLAPPLNRLRRKPLLLLLKHYLIRIKVMRIVDQNANITKRSAPQKIESQREKRVSERNLAPQTNVQP
jgi:hypothetical protein